MAQERGAQTVADLVELAATRPRRSHGKRQLAFGAPQQAGVYLFRDRHDQVLYVGKARDLRARLRSYFRSERQRPAVEAALGALTRIEWRVTGSELEAALTELRLIRELRPPANARSARDPTVTSTCGAAATAAVCSTTPGPLGPIKSRRRAQLAARALQGVDWQTLDDAVPKLQQKLRRLAREQRFEDAARLRDRIAALEQVAGEIARFERLRVPCRLCRRAGRGGRAARLLRREGPGRVRPAVSRSPRRRVAGGPGRSRARRAQPGAGGDRRAARDSRVHPAAASRAGGRLPTLPGMDDLRERGAGDGWRKLVADGVTATPVALRRGAAVKLVDGASTEIVPRADWPARLDAILAEARNVHLLSPDGDVHARRTKRGRWLVSNARPSSPAAVGDQHDREAQHPLPEGHPLFTATKISRDKERQVQHYVELLRTLPLWQRDRIRVVDAGCGKAYMSLALVAYGREVGTRVELVGLDANAGVIETVRGIAEQLGYDEASFEATTIAGYAATARSTCSCRCTPATRRATRRSPPGSGSGPKRSWSRHAATTSLPGSWRSGRRTASCATASCSAGRRTSSPTRSALRRSRPAAIEVDVIEFVATEHTPKNVMLRAERAPSATRAARARREYVALRDYWQVAPAIERLLGSIA